MCYCLLFILFVYLVGIWELVSRYFSWMWSECFFIKSNFNFGGGLISGVCKRENWGIIGVVGVSGELIRVFGCLDCILEGY